MTDRIEQLEALLQDIVDGGLTLDTVEERLRPLVPEYTHTPDRWELLSQMVAQAIRRETPAETIAREVLRQIDAGRPMSFMSGAMADYEPVQWLVEGWVPRGSMGMLTGLGDFGKSRWALQLAFAMATGHGWNQLGMTSPDRTIRAMYCSYEDSDSVLAERLEAIASLTGWESPDIPPGLFIADSGMMMQAGPLWGRHENLQSLAQPMPGLDTVCEAIAGTGVELVVVDTLANSFLSNENDRSEVSRFANHMQAIAQRANVSFLFLAHPPKTNESLYSGSTAWQGSVRYAMSLASPTPPEGLDMRRNADKELLASFREANKHRSELTQWKSNYGAQAGTDHLRPTRVGLGSSRTTQLRMQGWAGGIYTTYIYTPSALPASESPQTPMPKQDTLTDSLVIGSDGQVDRATAADLRSKVRTIRNNKALMQQLWDHQGGHCGRPEGTIKGCLTVMAYDEWELDHVVPISRGGDPLATSNLQLLCQDCNRVCRNATEAELEAAGAVWHCVEGWQSQQTSLDYWTAPFQYEPGESPYDKRLPLHLEAMREYWPDSVRARLAE